MDHPVVEVFGPASLLLVEVSLAVVSRAIREGPYGVIGLVGSFV